MNCKKLLCCLAIGAMLGSCSSDDMDNLSNQNMSLVTKSASMSVGGVSIFQEDGMLSFANLDEFQRVVHGLENCQTITSKLQANVPILEEEQTLNLEGFKSIYEDYQDALNESENYYDSESHYVEFKEKYSNLYFPEYEDDYSVYLPVSDKNIAKLLNTDGDVKINGEVINMKDVFTYEKLVELREIMSDNENSRIVYADEYLNGTPKLDKSGYRIKVRVYTEPGSSGVGEVIIVDVSFRKKGFLGVWYNYKSSTTVGWVNGASWSKSGFSSHDYKFARIYKGGVAVPFKGDMFVDYKDYGGKILFKVNL